MYINKFPIAILLSTYNGEKYLSELIESVLSQTNKDFTLYIRDDGSTDTTIKIIDEYTRKDSRIIFLDDKRHLGPTLTFLYMLEEIDSPYYMFCDQDDVWLDNKIEITINKMKELEKIHSPKPILVYTDVTVTDGQLNVIAPSMWEYSHMNVDMPTSFNYICVSNNVSACTSMINRNCRDIVEYRNINLPKKIYHDWWIAICVSRKKGIIYPIKQPTLLFRRHGNNETNVSSESRSMSSKIKRLHKSYTLIHQRYEFFKSIGYGSFLKYLCYKSIVSFKSRK